MLLSCSIRIFNPKLLKMSAHYTFNDMKYIKDELTYGVNENQLWVCGKHMKIQLDWEYAKVWEERAGWQKVSSDHCPIFWFKISD